MNARSEKAVQAGSLENEKKGELHPGHDENCRCKETSNMTPRQLIDLMINDLAFWKKKNKG